MKKMATLLLVVFFSVCANNVFADPTPVKVYGSYFSIAGNIDGSDYISKVKYSDSYADSGSVPLSDSVTYGNYYNGGSASSQAGLFYVGAKAGGGYNGPNTAMAVAEVLFQPLSSIDQLTIYYQGGLDSGIGGSSSGQIEVIDITDGKQIFSQSLFYSRASSSLNNGSYFINSLFQTDHVYKLLLSAQADSCYDSYYVNIWTNDMTAMVPEPVNILLLILGLIGIEGARRKKK